MYTMNKCFDVKVDVSRKYQAIDGFGVNINSKYWDNGNLIPVMELLIDDLGATLFRLDAYGKSNWMDPQNQFDESVLNKENYERVYQGPAFKNAEAMSKYLNARGIEPYITISGVVPAWMCEADGVTLKRYELFSEMVASYIDWAKNKAGIRFTLFGPLNETDLGPPEGPSVTPEEYIKAMEVLVDTLDVWNLKDIKLVIAEQGRYNLDFARELLKSKKLVGRVGVFGVHAYSDYHATDLVDTIKNSEYRDCKVWMTEYGDLDESGEREWYVAWVAFQRLMRLLEDGMTGALNWDAFDNYHDHDEAWTLYGLIRSGRKIYTPKKRFFSTMQMYRFVRPGFIRVASECITEGIRTLAFISPDGKDFTVVGMNETNEDVLLNVDVPEGAEKLPGRKAYLYVTTVKENCARTATRDVVSRNYPYTGVEVEAPANSIFTVTTLKA